MRLDIDTPGHRALRFGCRSRAQRIYLLTFVTRRRQRHFGHAMVAHAVAREMDDRHLWRNHDLHAWVLMPDHAHVLCELAGDESLSALVARVKEVTATLANSVLGRRGTFWSRGYHDHALRTHERMRQTVRYLVANPVRAGLVHDPWMWPYWNSRWIDTFDDLLTPGE
jgi:REP element-mobilizing transposase RayT